MKIILKEDLAHLGKIGELATVKDGYARNFLLPKGLAVVATRQELVRVEAQRARLDRQRTEALEEATKEAERLKDLKLTIEVKVSDEGQMYGSVGVNEISRELEEKGFEIEKRQILLTEPIKELGEHTVPIRIHTELTVDVPVTVVREADKDE